jgi:DNA processing protein
MYSLYKKTAFEKNLFLSSLLETPDCPNELYVLGELPEITPNTKVLVVVGSRKYTSYGKDVCQKLITGLAGTDTIIVSGLALGIDGIAHRAALDAGLCTIAIPGSGLSSKVLYPKSHFALANEIVERGGALISEYAPDTASMPYMFPARNRIMAGLAHAVLVIEAEEKSGTLITARLATEYNRDVLTVPGNIFSDTAKGPHMLIRLGATPITCPENLHEALGFEKSEDKSSQSVLPLDISDAERKLLDILYEPKSKDILLAEADMTTTEALMNISLLEIKGLVKEELGVIRRC